MKSDQLVERLVKSYQGPVKPLAVPERRFVLWAAVAFALVIIQMVGTGNFRSGWAEQVVTYPRLGLEVLLGFGVWISAALLAFRTAVPDLNNERPGRRLLLPLLSLLFMTLLLISIVAPAMPPTMSGKRHNCHIESILFGVVPAVVLFSQVRRGFVLNTLSTSLFIGIAAFLPTGVLMHISCMYDPLHILKFHIAPAILGTVFFALVSRPFLGPYKRS